LISWRGNLGNIATIITAMGWGGLYSPITFLMGWGGLNLLVSFFSFLLVVHNVVDHPTTILHIPTTILHIPTPTTNIITITIILSTRGRVLVLGGGVWVPSRRVCCLRYRGWCCGLGCWARGRLRRCSHGYGKRCGRWGDQGKYDVTEGVCNIPLHITPQIIPQCVYTMLEKFFQRLPHFFPNLWLHQPQPLNL
jgi:hypothetical protein